MVRFIAAIDEKLGLADEHGIPWQGKVPGDVAQFRRKTLGGTVMMGAGWYKEQTKPLPDRRNVVATNSPEALREGFDKATDARQFLQQSPGDVWVGGGAGLFASTFDLAKELHLTRITGDFHCTKFFPSFEGKFRLQSESQPMTENGITYKFQIWVRQ